MDINSDTLSTTVQCKTQIYTHKHTCLAWWAALAIVLKNTSVMSCLSFELNQQPSDHKLSPLTTEPWLHYKQVVYS